MIKKVICLLLIIFVIVFSFYYYSNNHKKVETDNNNNNNNTKEVDERPSDNEPYTESKTIKSEVADDAKEIELKYDEYVVANGYIGASDNAYFTRNNVLYHLVISSDTVSKIAEGVKKIEDEKDTLFAYKGENFKIIKEDEYITYID